MPNIRRSFKVSSPLGVLSIGRIWFCVLVFCSVSVCLSPSISVPLKEATGICYLLLYLLLTSLPASVDLPPLSRGGVTTSGNNQRNSSRGSSRQVLECKNSLKLSFFESEKKPTKSKKRQNILYFLIFFIVTMGKVECKHCIHSLFRPPTASEVFSVGF